MTLFFSRLTLLASLLCTGMLAYAAPEYSAIQRIDTVPGPFLNHIYIANGKERQDASLGGQTVTTIIRQDQGVAWLLIPSKKQYQVIDIQAAKTASVQALFHHQAKTEIGTETIDGLATKKYALTTDDGSQPTIIWLADNGIVVKADIPANPQNGSPQATVRLTDIQLGTQNPALFDLPAGYVKTEN